MTLELETAVGDIKIATPRAVGRPQDPVVVVQPDNADAPPDRASRARLDEIGRFSRGQMDKTVPLESLLERLVM